MLIRHLLVIGIPDQGFRRPPHDKWTTGGNNEGGSDRSAKAVKGSVKAARFLRDSDPRSDLNKHYPDKAIELKLP